MSLPLLSMGGKIQQWQQPAVCSSPADCSSPLKWSFVFCGNRLGQLEIMNWATGDIEWTPLLQQHQPAGRGCALNLDRSGVQKGDRSGQILILRSQGIGDPALHRWEPQKWLTGVHHQDSLSVINSRSHSRPNHCNVIYHLGEAGHF